MSTPPWGQDPDDPSTPPPPYQPYAAPSPYPVYPVTPPTNGLAIASLIVSIASIMLCCGLPGIAGAIMGHAARKQIREQSQSGDGLALGGIIVGWIAFGLSLLAIAFYVVLFAGLVALDGTGCYTDSNGDYVCD